MFIFWNIILKHGAKILGQPHQMFGAKLKSYVCFTAWIMYWIAENKEVANPDFKQFSIFIEYCVLKCNRWLSFPFTIDMYITYVNIIFTYSVMWCILWGPRICSSYWSENIFNDIYVFQNKSTVIIKVGTISCFDI